MPNAEIIDIKRRTQIDDLGNVMEVFQVEFRSAKGIVDRVRVPVATAPEDIRRIVAEAAQRLDILVGPV